MKTASVHVHQLIEVTVDEAKFTDKFMQSFRDSMYPLHDVEDHLQHLAQLAARGVADNGSFIEGYGPAKEFGIKFKWVDGYEEIDHIAA